MWTRARAATIVVASCAGVALGAQNPPQRGDDPNGAARYFIEMRASPGGRIPPRARQAALAQMHARWPALMRRSSSLAAAPAGTSATWVPLGPRPLSAFGQLNSGRLNSIAIHPENPNVIYVGGAQGGVWKTITGGASWTPMTDTQCSLAMGSIALDPVNPEIIYAGTGEQNFSGDSYYGCGVLKSTDGGQSWTELGKDVFDFVTGGRRISKVVVDRGTANGPGTVVFAATDAGLYRSANAGVTWARASTTQLLGAVTDIVADPVNAGVFYAANGDLSGPTRNGIFRTSDNGLTWTKVWQPPALTGAGRINLAIAPSLPSTVYAAVEAPHNGSASAATLQGIWATTDGGATWSQRLGPSTSLCGEQCWYNMVIAVDPASPSTVYFGGISLYKSTDGAATFTNIGQAIHVDHHAFAFHPGRPSTIYSGNDGGIHKSENGGATWTSLNANLELTQFYPGVSVSPTSSTTILGGTQDNGTLQWSGAATWPTVLGGDGGFTAIDQVTGATAFAETQWVAPTVFGGPRRRDPGGSNFDLRRNGINTNDRALFIPPLVMDPARPRIVYFGTFNLYRSGNSGDLWTNIGPSLVAGGGSISSIGVAPTDSLTLYVGSSDGRLSYTHNLGGTWSTAAGAGSGPVTDIAVDPRDANHAIMVRSGFIATSKVWRTTDGGVTWTNLTFDLPNIPVLAVVLESGSRDITIGTDLGVFTLRSGSSSWAPVLNGLPNVAVYDLIHDDARSRLIAATHGRGMFSLDVSVMALRGDVAGPRGTPPDGVIGVLDAQVILAMAVGNAPPAGSRRFPSADANCDGEISALDAMIVLRRAAGLTNPGACVGTVR